MYPSGGPEMLRTSARKLINKRCERKRGAISGRLRERDPEILSHPVDGKPKIKLIANHGLSAVCHLPGTRSTLFQNAEHLIHIETGVHAKGCRFGKPLNYSGNADLIHHLRELSGPGFPNPVTAQEKAAAAVFPASNAPHHRRT